MKFKLGVSGVAFVLTFAISISGNIFFTSFKRSLFAFVLFYIFSSIVERLLEKELDSFNKYSCTSDDSDTIKNDQNSGDDQNIDKNNNENSNDGLEFQGLDYDKIENIKTKNGDIDIDNMDPKTIATILRNIEDNPK